MKPVIRSSPRRLAPALLAGIALLVPLGVGTALACRWELESIPYEALIEGLRAADATTRARSAQFLGLRTERDAVPALIAVVQGPEEDPAVLSAAYFALGQIGEPPALPVLKDCVTSEDRPELRADCLTALGDLHDPDALAPVLDAYRNETSPLVRGRAVDVLGSFPDAAAVAPLAALATDGNADAALRQRAVQALGRTGMAEAAAPLLATLAHPVDAAELVPTVRSLGEIRAKQAAKPLEALLAQTSDPRIKAEIVIALGAISDGSSYPTLVAMLDDPVPALRYLAIESLHALGKPEAAGPLNRTATAMAEEIRQGLGDPEGSPARLVVLARTLSAALRALIDLDAAAGAAAMIATATLPEIDAASTPLLVVKTELFESRRIALHGLGSARTAAAAEVLRGPAGVGEADYRLRAVAVRSLAISGEPEAAAQIAPYLDDQAAEVRWMAALSLGRLGDRAAAAALGGGLDDENARVRREATLALGYLGDSSQRAQLVALAEGDPSRQVREAASYALQLIDEAEATP